MGMATATCTVAAAAIITAGAEGAGITTAGGITAITRVGCQPRAISTAMRIRSEWFFAPSFCFSSDVVLATVL